MDQVAKNLPEIIKASASSPLGILALMIIALAVLAFYFFKSAKVKVRVGIFVMLFVGVVAMAGVILRQSKIVVQRAQSNDSTPSHDVSKPGSGRVVPEPKSAFTVIAPTYSVTAGPGTYKVLSTDLSQISDENLKLSFKVRYTRDETSWSGGTLLTDNFRLFVDEVPMSPTKGPSETVGNGSAKECVVEFTIPIAVKNLILQVGERAHGVRKIPLEVKAAK